METLTQTLPNYAMDMSEEHVIIYNTPFVYPIHCMNIPTMFQ